MERIARKERVGKGGGLRSGSRRKAPLGKWRGTYVTLNEFGVKAVGGKVIVGAF